jgi:hypothetical protein
MNYAHLQAQAGYNCPRMVSKPRRTAAQQAKMHLVMGEYKRGQLHSGSKHGPLVRNRQQAIAIGLNQSGQSRRRK